MPFIVPAFTSKLDENFGEGAIADADADPNKPPTQWATGWSDAVNAGAVGIIPPSTTHDAAKAAMKGVLMSVHHQSDSTLMTLQNGIITYAGVMAPGMLPGFSGIPPAGPPAVASVFLPVDPAPGGAFLDYANALGGVLAAWFPTGMAIMVPSPFTPMPWA